MTRAQRSAVRACVQEAHKRLKEVGVHVRVSVRYRSPYVVLAVKRRTIYIPRWQGQVRTDPDLRSNFVDSLIHEFGHVYFNTYWQKVVAGGTRLFGVFAKPYKIVTSRNICNLMRRSPGYISRYAQMHPLEDFAETFLYIIQHRLKPPRTADKVLQRKLTYMVRLLKD